MNTERKGPTDEDTNEKQDLAYDKIISRRLEDGPLTFRPLFMVGTEDERVEDAAKDLSFYITRLNGLKKFAHHLASIKSELGLAHNISVTSGDIMAELHEWLRHGTDIAIKMTERTDELITKQLGKLIGWPRSRIEFAARAVLKARRTNTEIEL